MADAEIFRTTIGIEHLSKGGPVQELAGILVDTLSGFTWIPRAVLDSLGIEPERKQAFIVAGGKTINRDIGYAIIHAGPAETADNVVFADPHDAVILGARSLDGLNLRLDVVRKELVDAGPTLAATPRPDPHFWNEPEKLTSS
jgi:predicted aspartyl protease